MSGTEAAPLRSDEADRLLEPLRAFGSLILAVSGGTDSTALMHLVSAWSRRQPDAGRRLIAVTVDHGLRPEAASEAAEVARQAAALGIEHRTLHWQGAKPATGIQAAARRARYDLLHAVAAQAAMQVGGTEARVVIVTAHTADDQAETLLMRLARGAGVDGLAAIPAWGRCERPAQYGARQSFPIFRPLLGLARARLAATLEAAGIGHADDPSNRDRRFERVRVREALAVLEGLGFTTRALARTVDRMQVAQLALEQATDGLWARAVGRRLGIVYEIDRELLVGAPQEIGQRLLRRALAVAGGAAKPAELAAIEESWHRLASASSGGLTFTLGGCIVEGPCGRLPPGGRIRIYREPDRGGGLPSVVLGPGEGVLWDERIWAEVSPQHAGPVELGPLGADWPRLARRYACLEAAAVPAAAARGLPAFRAGGNVVAVPLLAAYARSCGDEAAAAALAGPCGNDRRLPQLQASPLLPCRDRPP